MAQYGDLIRVSKTDGVIMLTTLDLTPTPSNQQPGLLIAIAVGSLLALLLLWRVRRIGSKARQMADGPVTAYSRPFSTADTLCAVKSGTASPPPDLLDKILNDIE